MKNINMINKKYVTSVKTLFFSLTKYDGLNCVFNQFSEIIKNRYLSTTNLSKNEFNREFLLPLNLQNKIGLGKENLKDYKLPFDIKGGYRSYNVVLFLSSVNSESKDLIITEFKKVIKGLESNKIYSLLVNVISESNKQSASILPRAIFLHSNSSHIELGHLVLNRLQIYEAKYDSDDVYGLVLSVRVWYTKDELLSMDKGKKFKEISKKVDENLLDKVKSEPFLDNNIKKIIDKGLQFKITPAIINELKIINGDFSFTLYGLEEYCSNPNAVLLAFNHNKNTIYYLIEDGNISLKWTDSITENGTLRKLDEISILFNSNGKDIIKVDLKYNFKRLLEVSKKYKKDLNIGTIDLETYTVDKLGTQRVYAAGWTANGEVFTYYLKDKGCNNSIELIQTLFNDIFKSNYSKYTFYIHNLSNFDSVFIIDTLTRDNCLIKPIIKDDGTLISLSVSKKIKLLNNEVKVKNEKRTIKMYDSALMLNNSLRNLCKEFNCTNLKGNFPYKFITEETLEYCGNTPSYEFFDSISLSEYNKLFPLNYKFSVKSETLKYLKSDLLGLKELMIKFANIVFEEFGLNITDFKTISGLSLHIYLSNFYNIDSNIMIIKGGIEKEIRKAYFGGIVSMAKKGMIINKGYFYDVNSQYPSVMLKPMPVGNPSLSNDTNLESYFGFCYVNIIPPKNLNTYVIPYRDEEGKITCPSRPFSGFYFSELLKKSLDYGYKLEVKGGLKFEKGLNIFNSFIYTLYEKRLQAKAEGNNSLQKVLKLVLNSLYGRMGMRNIENRLEIVNKDRAQFLLQKKNILKINEFNDKIMIKYNNNINNEILKLIDSNTLSILNSNIKINSLVGLTKERGAPSSIPIAAAITAYAQLEMMKFKNIPGNRMLYSDTDSLLMEYPLPDEYVHPNKLGKLKLENIIIEGFFISPKFYSFKNSEGNIIMKTKGVDKNKLNFEDFKHLAEGKDLTVKTTVFSKNLQKGNVNISERDYTIKGIIN